MNLTHLLPLLLLITFTNSLTEVANFPLIPNIKTGDHKAINTRLSANTNRIAPQTYNRTFASPPIVAIGLVVFEMQAGINLSFTVEVFGITTTGFQTNITAKTDTFINQLLYTYIAIDSSAFFGNFVLQTFDLSGNNNITNRNITKIVNVFTLAVNLSHSIIVKTFIKDFSAIRLNNDLSIRIQNSIKSTTQIQLTFFTNCTITAVSLYIFWIDRTALEQNQQYYLDPGYAITQYGGTSYAQFNVLQANFNYFNFMRGANWIAFNANTNNTLFSFNILSYPFTTVASFYITAANLVHWRKRQCPTSTYYYMQAQSKCYDTCPTGYANNPTLKYCKKCNYDCLTCHPDGTCLSCSTASFRMMSNGDCNCMTGYFDITNQSICGVCDYTCKTCQINSTYCTSCDSSRNLLNNNCECNTRMYDQNTNNPVCQSCHFSCLSCISTANTCQSCSILSNRILLLTSCLCKSGYMQPTPAALICIVSTFTCSSNCQTCQSTSTNCTGCIASFNRVLSTINTCICKSGYQSANDNDKCRQICGDGHRYQSQCDDGNNDNGDGCSASCTIESDFICNITVEPNICLYKYDYIIKLISIKKKYDSNLLDLIFSIDPSAPAGSIAKLSNLPLNIESQLIKSGRIQLIASYTDSIPLSALAKLSLSTIPTSLKFQVKTDNSLKLTYYTQQNYQAFKIEVGFTWFFIVLLWIGIFITVILYRNGLLIISEYMYIVGIVWIGIQGFDDIGLFYQPLTYLKYIFAYNTKINGQDGLFAYVNYGLLLTILPALIFGIGFIVQKIKKYKLFMEHTKKYLLIQLTYVVIYFYGIIIMYGLTTQQYTKTYQTALSITSIIFGILYFIFLMLCTIYFIKKEQKFVYLTYPFMPLHKSALFYIGSYTAKLLTILIYMLTRIIVNLKYSPLIFCGISVITIIMAIVVKPYQNNVRVLCNQFIIISTYLCYYLVLEISNAQWGGFLILMILYVGMIGNFALLVRHYIKDKYIQETDIETDTQREANLANNTLDMDFDPHKIIQDRMFTVKKQQFQNLENPYAKDYTDNNQMQNGITTLRKGIVNQME